MGEGAGDTVLAGGPAGRAASQGLAGVARHGVAYAGPGLACVCKRRDCGGVVPVDWCREHGRAVGPVMEWHPGGALPALAGRRTGAWVAGALPALFQAFGATETAPADEEPAPATGP